MIVTTINRRNGSTKTRAALGTHQRKKSEEFSASLTARRDMAVRAFHSNYEVRSRFLPKTPNDNKQAFFPRALARDLGRALLAISEESL